MQRSRNGVLPWRPLKSLTEAKSMDSMHAPLAAAVASAKPEAWPHL